MLLLSLVLPRGGGRGGATLSGGRGKGEAMLGGSGGALLGGG